MIGGGDTALEDALYLSRMAKTVYLVHRRDTFRANAALQEAVQKTENIVLVTDAVPTEITGEKRVETLKLLRGGSPEELSLDGVFVAIGSVPNTSLLEGFAELDSSGYVQAGEDGRTSVEGLFAAGTCGQRHCAGNHSGGGRCKLCGFCGKISVGKQRIKMVMK